MWSQLVVIDPPGLDDPASIGDIGEPVLAQTLVPEVSAEALHEAVLDRLPGLDEVGPDA